MRFFRPCFFAGWLYPDAIFRIKTSEKILFLTFDDGPDPESTPQLLNILDRHDIKALFFCSGEAAERYPDLVKKILSNGHALGNHGYNHLNGWKVSTNSYFEDIEKASHLTSARLFRPPYGRLRISQYKKLKEKYKIIFWDLMPYDFEDSFGLEKSIGILKSKIRPGSIIVLHDTSHSAANEIIESLISHTHREGYRFELIS